MCECCPEVLGPKVSGLELSSSTLHEPGAIRDYMSRVFGVPAQSVHSSSGASKEVLRVLRWRTVVLKKLRLYQDMFLINKSLQLGSSDRLCTSKGRYN